MVVRIWTSPDRNSKFFYFLRRESRIASYSRNSNISENSFALFHTSKLDAILSFGLCACHLHKGKSTTPKRSTGAARSSSSRREKHSTNDREEQGCEPTKKIKKKKDQSSGCWFIIFHGVYTGKHHPIDIVYEWKQHQITKWANHWKRSGKGTTIDPTKHWRRRGDPRKRNNQLYQTRFLANTQGSSEFSWSSTERKNGIDHFCRRQRNVCWTVWRPEMTIDHHQYIKKSPCFLPPLFSVMLRNVPTEMKEEALLKDIQEVYPDARNAFRLSNKDSKPIFFVRLDLANITSIEELLKKKALYINGRRFTVTEYISPAKVLICSRCFRIGHFRGACQHPYDVCKTCGEDMKNPSEHQCTTNGKCVRCMGDHATSDIECPVVKQFRAELTRTLLTTSQNTSSKTADYVGINDKDFPVLTQKGNGIGQNNRSPSHP